MTDQEISALAKGLAPFVRQCVAEAITPLTTRLTQAEARPIEKGEPGPKGDNGEPGPPGPKGDAGDLNVLVTPELAEQIKQAIHLLHESPPIIERDDRAVVKPPPRVLRIERDDDGNLVPIYEESPA